VDFLRILDAGEGLHFGTRICCQLLNPEFGSIAMMDVVMLAVAFFFFAVSIAYVYACDQL
jgi:hypothetical protein